MLLFKESSDQNIAKIYIVYTIFYFFKSNIFFRRSCAYCNSFMHPSNASVTAYPLYLEVAWVIEVL